MGRGLLLASSMAQLTGQYYVHSTGGHASEGDTQSTVPRHAQQYAVAAVLFIHVVRAFSVIDSPLLATEQRTLLRNTSNALCRFPTPHDTPDMNR